MKEVELKTKDAINYLKENVKIHDRIQISYDRIFAEGEVLNMDFSEYFGKPGFKMLVSLDESALGATIEIDIYQVSTSVPTVLTILVQLAYTLPLVFVNGSL